MECFIANTVFYKFKFIIFMHLDECGSQREGPENPSRCALVKGIQMFDMDRREKLPC